MKRFKTQDTFFSTVKQISFKLNFNRILRATTWGGRICFCVITINRIMKIQKNTPEVVWKVGGIWLSGNIVLNSWGQKISPFSRLVSNSKAHTSRRQILPQEHKYCIEHVQSQWNNGAQQCKLFATPFHLARVFKEEDRESCKSDPP